MFKDTDDEVDGQKRKKNLPGRRRKQTLSDSASKNSKRDLTGKLSTAAEHSKNESSPTKKGSAGKARKYSLKRTRKPKKSISENEEKCDDADDDDKQKDSDSFKPGSIEGQVKRFFDESSECEETAAAQDSNDHLKSNSPEHQTAESESGKSFE